ncbi:hypothetical protein GJ496_001938 [Pomphorhynchus laevis]|nr:hypothetical protein GJ496_001938 [Pomphorhynchus laevis]
MTNLTNTDFQHIHNELMKHKEIAYELNEKCRRYEIELEETRSKYKFKTFGRLKQSNKEAELQRENEILQHKMLTMEKEHELKVETLKQELQDIRKLTFSSKTVDMFSPTRKSLNNSSSCRSITDKVDAECFVNLKDMSEDRLSLDLIEQFDSSVKSAFVCWFEQIEVFITKLTASIHQLTNYCFNSSVHYTLMQIVNTVVTRENMPSEQQKSDKLSLPLPIIEVTDQPPPSSSFKSKLHETNDEIRFLNGQLHACQKKYKAMIKDLQRELKVERKRNASFSINPNRQQGDQPESIDTFTEDRSVDSMTDETRSNMSYANSWTNQLTDQLGILKDSSRYSYHSRILSLNDDFKTSYNLDMQRERNVLLEKVKHLEASNASMANDLVIKSNLIQQLAISNVNEVKETIKPRRKIPFANKSVPYIEVEKLQRALEVTLKKNLEMDKVLSEMSGRSGQSKT